MKNCNGTKAMFIALALLSACVSENTAENSGMHESFIGSPQDTGLSAYPSSSTASYSPEYKRDGE